MQESGIIMYFFRKIYLNKKGKIIRLDFLEFIKIYTSLKGKALI